LRTLVDPRCTLTNSLRYAKQPSSELVILGLFRMTDDIRST
jgi:hypothetical protein